MENYEYYGDDFDAASEVEQHDGNEIFPVTYGREMGIPSHGHGNNQDPLGRLLPSMYAYEEESSWNSFQHHQQQLGQDQHANGFPAVSAGADGDDAAVLDGGCADFCSSAWKLPDEIRWPPPPPPAPPSLLDESDESLPDGLLSMVASSSASSSSSSSSVSSGILSSSLSGNRSCHYCHWATEETAPGIVEIFRKGEAPNDVIFVIVTACCVGGALLGVFIALAVFKRRRRRSKLLANDASSLTNNQRQRPMSKSNSGAGLGICEAALYGTAGSTSSSRSRGSSAGGLIPCSGTPLNHGAATSAVYWAGGGPGGSFSKTTTMTVENHYTSIEEASFPTRDRRSDLPQFPAIPDEQFRLKAGLGMGNYYSSTLTKSDLVSRNILARDHFPCTSRDLEGSPRRQRRSRTPALGQNRTLIVKPNRSSSFLLVHPNPGTFERDPRNFYEDPLFVQRHEGSFDPGRQQRRRRRERRPRVPPPSHAPPPPPPPQSLSPMRFVNRDADPSSLELDD